MQEVLTKVYVRWGRIGAMDNPDSYIRRMIVNEHLSWRRRLARRRETSEPHVLPEAVAGSPDQVSDRAELEAEIARLPPRLRSVVVLRFLEDLTVEETAHVLGCGLSTVRAHTARALARLRINWPDDRPAPASVVDSPEGGHRAH